MSDSNGNSWAVFVTKLERETSDGKLEWVRENVDGDYVNYRVWPLSDFPITVYWKTGDKEWSLDNVASVYVGEYPGLRLEGHGNKLRDAIRLSLEDKLELSRDRYIEQVMTKGVM